MEEPSVIFQDNHLLVLYKPSGLLTQPSGQLSEDSLEAFGKEWIKRNFQKPGQVFLEAVHRIDRPVSGIVLFARTSKALSRLQAAQREGKFRKLYLALVEGTITAEEGQLVHFLIHEEHRAVVTHSKDSRGKESVLNYRRLERRGDQTLLEIELVTGRYHQIRAQFAAIGKPIVGDIKYGAKNAPFFGLHHSSLEVPHPITHEMMLWESTPSWLNAY